MKVELSPGVALWLRDTKERVSDGLVGKVDWLQRHTYTRFSRAEWRGFVGAHEEAYRRAFETGGDNFDDCFERYQASQLEWEARSVGEEKGVQISADDWVRQRNQSRIKKYPDYKPQDWAIYDRDHALLMFASAYGENYPDTESVTREDAQKLGIKPETLMAINLSEIPVLLRQMGGRRSSPTHPHDFRRG